MEERSLKQWASWLWCTPKNYCIQCWRTLQAAIVFYTALPFPVAQDLPFEGVARWAAVVGLLIGSLLALLDGGLQMGGLPVLTRSALVVVAWIAITGGLHLDGAMDTADGLAVQDPERRLQVMADSHSGAFGVMAAIAIVLLKTVALAELDISRRWALMAVAGWGRWGQLVAIARYSYLKPTGKGAFHKTAIRSTWEALPSFMLLIALSVIQLGLGWADWKTATATVLAGTAIALLAGVWFDRRLGGHTGDTYGAVVEWTETLMLCLLAAL